MNIIQSAPKQKNSDVSLQTKKIKISSKHLGEITHFMWIGRKQAQISYESRICYFPRVFITSEENKNQN